MNRYWTSLCTALLLLPLIPSFAQAPLDLTKKQLQALKTPLAIQVDGTLDEAVWQSATPAGNFIQNTPQPGKSATRNTEVKILYDDAALYIGAVMQESYPDSILRQITERDRDGNTDWFGLFLDPYRDGINGFYFLVTAAGVQIDARITPLFEENGGNSLVRGEDRNWDAVWESEIQMLADGWSVEMRIPYAAIRFPRGEEQLWHINFARSIRRLGEISYWNGVDPQTNGFLNQAGYLMGIREISPPLRLQATPFVAVYGEYHYDKSAEQPHAFGRSINGGMDIKLGLNDAFTLDMTLIPDFGEAQSDNQVLNLSPFEIQFNENRQFFTEGTELFNKGDLFYSRRVGGTPLRYHEVADQLSEGELIVDNPQQTRLFNATKISGRDKNGLGLGFFNATAAPMEAVIQGADGAVRRIATNPLTNYNIFVLDQNLKNNSYVNFINTTVFRSGADYDANVTGMGFNLNNKTNTYAFEGRAALSQLYHTDGTELGHTYNFGFRKSSGNFQFGAFHNLESATYNPNDLGLLFANNESAFIAWAEYTRYEPFGHFNRGGVGMSHGYQRLQDPSVFTGYGLDFWTWAQTKNLWSINVWSSISPFEGYDYFEPRTPGRYFRTPTSSNLGFWIGTDNRKRLRISTNGNFSFFGEDGRHAIGLNLTPRYQASDKLIMEWSLFSGFMKQDVGFVNRLEMADETRVIFGRRDRRDISNTATVNYAFHKNANLSFRMRHNWSRVAYLSFEDLQTDGTLQPSLYTGLHDTNFNAFNIDMIFRWRFAPGSDLFVIWKDAILNFDETAALDYSDNVSQLFDYPQTNSLSIKIIYFVDYLKLKGRA